MISGQARKKSKLLSVLSAMIVIFAMMASVSINDVKATTSQRNNAISSMSSMRNQKWIANGNVNIYNYSYLSGIEYTGIPYNQGPRLTTISAFLTNSFMTYSSGHYCLSDPTPELGNDCSSAVALSWSAGGSSIVCSQVDTIQMLSAVKSTKNCMAKRGTYSTGYSYTQYMVHATTKENLYNSLVAGDACFYKTAETGNGHAILITSVNVSEKTVYYIEQIGGSTRLSGTHSTWTAGTKTFQQLYDGHYVPIRPTDI